MTNKTSSATTEQNVTPADVQLLDANVSSIVLAASYSGGKVNWEGRIRGNSNTAQISATFTLEKQNTNGSYKLVESWPDSTASATLNSSGSKATPNGRYKLSVSATVTDTSGSSEIVSNWQTYTFS